MIPRAKEMTNKHQHDDDEHERQSAEHQKPDVARNLRRAGDLLTEEERPTDEERQAQ